MYEAFFRLSSRPFSPHPRTDRYFPAAEMEQARTSALRAIERAEGMTVVIGPPGTGKTLLCRMVEEAFAGDFDVVALQGVRLGTRRALLQSLLFGLGLPHRDGDENDFRLAMLAYLENQQASPRGMLLTIDEADLLPMRVFEELRLLANVVKQGEPRMRLVLAGGPTLEEKLAHPRMESFQQRLGVRRYLHPWSRDEVRNYVRSQWQRVGGSPDRTFDEQAYAAIRQATGGFPRAINQVCDRALALAAEQRKFHVDAEIIEMAWADLLQLPMPTKAPALLAGRSGVIEFGSLADEDATIATGRRESGSMTIEASPDVFRTLDDEDSEMPSSDEGTLTFDFGDEDMGFGFAANESVDFDAAADSGRDFVATTERDFVATTERGRTWDPFAEAFGEEILVEDRISRLAPAAVTSFEARSASPASTRKEPSRIAASESVAKPSAKSAFPAKRTERVDAPPAERMGTPVEPRREIVRHEPADDSLEAELLDATLRISTLKFAPSDDRDLILVEEDVRDEAPKAEGAGRVDSRQLFARLRQS